MKANEPLPHETILQVREQLKELQVLSQQILNSASATKILDDRAQHEDEDLDITIRHLAAFLSPLRTLPASILANIFQHSLPSSGDMPREGFDRTPFRLSQVCRVWRNVALHSPSLWAVVHIEIPEKSQNGSGGLRDLVLLWLERSKNVPLSIRFSISPDISLTTRSSKKLSCDATVSAIFAALVSQSQRWFDVRLHLTCSTYPSLGSKTSLISDLNLPLLQTFHLSGGLHDPDNIVSGTSMAINLSRARSLRTFSLAHVSHGSPGASLPWSTLTTLSLIGPHQRLSIARCIDILIKCHQLKHCYMTIGSVGRLPVETYPPITLPYLQFARFHSYSVDLDDIFQLMTCSDLRELTVEYISRGLLPMNPYSWPQEALGSFLGRCPNLDRLHLWNLPITECQLIWITSQADSISTFTVKSEDGPYNPVGDRFVDSLVATNLRSTTKLPHLLFFSIESVTPSDHFIEKFVKSRWYPAKGIEKISGICLNMFRPWGESDALASRLEKYQDEGLDVQFWKSAK
jgi:hypothetical protein